MRFRHVVTSPLVLSLVTSSFGYDLVREYSGPSFFDGWDFFGSWDNLTLSSVWWLNQSEATAENLAYVNGAGQAIIRVDNTTNLPAGEDRNTVRITTKDFYDFGSIWVFDATHLPYGCSVWPAFWSKGPLWPDDGEIDIVEGINLQSSNQMALHTTSGCFTSNRIEQTGTLGFTNCSAGSGCTVHETKPNSFGQNFANAGGGVWATQFDVSGIYMWFWSRPDVPASLALNNKGSIDISSWGLPSASYPAITDDCSNFTAYFTPQQIVIDIALCGNWAGVPSIYQSSCPGLCSVSGPGSPAYDNAYFEINYVRAYTTGGPASTTTVSTATRTGSAATTNTLPATITTGAGLNGGTGAAASAFSPTAGATATLTALALAFLGLLLL
ncbi:concanavalin A-like lectin/glucanase domain-containing protein [Epithele typhae]|uniref:concanavalin A-like lectin/glucanase domain-containing protein n=1 Tax=Epithele typhae TaxID=378194 RepID=UPI0020086EC2|nr:concanavalin A-like lectin/glucanase domain-containing protein [Epithele typhae]KAH9942419.1 concanavalin A-like lectin/glucanase domain-containing protein [Epithele typhae]